MLMGNLPGHAARNSMIARRYFFDGKDIPTGTVHESILRSWQRVALIGIRPEQRVLFSDQIEVSRQRQCVDENRALIDLVSAEMNALARGFSSREWTVSCLNAQGVLVASSSLVVDHQESRAPLQPGFHASESVIGTCAPGCVLADDYRPTEVGRGEHYLHELVDNVCAAAPILDHRNQMIGMLNLSGFGVDLPSYALRLVTASATAIGNVTYGYVPGCRVVRLHYDHRFLHTPAEGIIAVSQDNVIVGANRVARRLLCLPDDGGVRVEFEAVFAGRLSNKHGAIPASVRTHTGAYLYVSMEPESRVRRRSGHPGPAASSKQRLEPVPGQPHEDVVMQDVFRRASLALRENVPVILLGETGTGKSRLAKALHDASRPGSRFVSIDCSAMPEGLVEAELFGYADGAFTGARKGGNPGKIELADRGTLFLDEIGDMPLSLQTRLLRVIQERTVTRVGSTREIGVDILVMCATHQDLSALVRRGVFREDLYFRLCGIAVRLPALRDRKDLPDLVNTALREFARGRDKYFDHDVMDFFLSYPWPGNLRELHQVIRTSVAISGDCERIGLEHFDAVWLEAVDRCRHGGFPVPAGARPKRTHRTSNEAIQSALNQLNGNRSEAARELGISRATIHRRILRGEVQ